MHEVNFQTINIIDINCMQYDKIYHIFIPKDGEEFVDLNDYKVEMYYELSNGESYKRECGINNNMIKIKISDRMTQNEGKVIVFLRFFNDEISILRKVAIVNVNKSIDINNAKEE